MSIYIDHDGRTIGPFSLEEINAKLAQGEIAASTMAWFQGWADWIPLSQVPGVNAETLPESSSPVPPAERVENPLRLTDSTDGPSASTGSPSSAAAASSSERDRHEAFADESNPQHRFYRQVFDGLELATGHLMQPFDLLDKTVQEKRPVDTTNFFRLFLGHAEKFTDDCTVAFAAVLRQSTQLDAVRATTVKQLARQIREEAFEQCDQALLKYHQTVTQLMGGVEAIQHQVQDMGTPTGLAGGALIGSLIAGRGSRVAGAAIGGLTASTNYYASLRKKIVLLSQAEEMIALAERMAPKQVGEYLDAVAMMPGALIDLLGARCFGAAVDLNDQQQCVQVCSALIRMHNQRAAASVRSMYQHVERLAAQAEAQATREAQAEKRKQEGKLSTRRRFTFWLLFAIWVGQGFTLLISAGAGVTLQDLMKEMIAVGVILAIGSYVVMGFLKSIGF